LSLALLLQDGPRVPPGDQISEPAVARSFDPHPGGRRERDEQVIPLRRRILIAEDHVALRETVRDILATQGYAVVEAQDGLAALEVLQESPFDVLILDLHMPGMDGVEVLRHIDPPPPVVIIHSAFEFYTPQAVRAQVGSKIFRYLRKPVPPLEFLSTVKDALDDLERETEERPTID
jgi:CheY-like chemotaxis protein